MASRQVDTSDATCSSTHCAHLRLIKAGGFTLAREQHDVAIAVGYRRTHQYIVLVEFDGAQTDAALTRKLSGGCFLDGAFFSGHEDELVIIVAIDRQNRGNSLSLIKREQVHHGATARITAGQRNMEHLQPIDLSKIREAQHCGMRACDQ